MTDDFTIDLDSARASRAASREAKGHEAPIRLGGETIAVLGAELPVDVLAPLRELDSDLTLILRQALGAARGQQSEIDSTDLVIDILSNNPNLPTTALDIIREVASNLLSPDGFARLVAQRPSVQDYAALAKGVFRWYGVSLGEALQSSVSSTDGGETSPGTSSTTSDSTPVESSDAPEKTGSWEPVGS